MRRLPWVAVVLTSAASALLWACPTPPASAAETGEFSLRPVRPADASPRDRSYIVHTVKPGEQLTDRLEALNLTDQPLELTIAPVDATVLADGSFAPGTTDTAVGSWFDVSRSQVRVPARGTATVEVTIRVPADAAPGDHIGAVVAQRADGRPSDGGGGVRVVQRVGVRAYLTVDRPRGQSPARRAFELRALRWTGAPAARMFEADVANVGDLLVEPLGTLAVERGGLSATVDVPVLGTVPPGESRSLRLSAPGELEPGTYRATVRLRDVNGGPEQEQQVSFTVGQAGAGSAREKAAGGDGDGRGRGTRFPWWLVLVALALLLAVSAWMWRERRKAEATAP